MNIHKSYDIHFIKSEVLLGAAWFDGGFRFRTRMRNSTQYLVSSIMSGDHWCFPSCIHTRGSSSNTIVAYYIRNYVFRLRPNTSNNSIDPRQWFHVLRSAEGWTSQRASIIWTGRVCVASSSYCWWSGEPSPMKLNLIRHRCGRSHPLFPPSSLLRRVCDFFNATDNRNKWRGLAGDALTWTRLRMSWSIRLFTVGFIFNANDSCCLQRARSKSSISTSDVVVTSTIPHQSSSTRKLNYIHEMFENRNF